MGPSAGFLPTTLVFLAFGALLAGCSSPPPAADVGPTGPTAPVPLPAVQRNDTFSWQAGAGEPVLGLGPTVGGSNAASIDLNGNGTLQVYANWTCATPTCDLHMYLYAPGEGPGNNGLDVTQSSGHAMGTSTLVIDVDASEPGKWTAAVFPASLDASVAGTFQFVFTPAGAAEGRATET